MKRFASIILTLGIISLISGFVLFALIFSSVIGQEIKYVVSKPKSDTEIIPVDKDFGIVIPKIGANAKIIPQVDPYDSNKYQYALTKGVAQAKGTSYPDIEGNMFLFAHSSVDFYEAQKYNSIFYLLSKLEKEDKIDIYFKQQKYIYHIIEKKLVYPSEVSYLTNKSKDKSLTLMTCWPPGTTYKRLIVTAVLQ